MVQNDVRPSPGRYTLSKASSGVAVDRPEFRLTAVCCRWPPSDTRDDAIRRAAARVTDWQGFRDIVQRQRVAGLVHYALTSTGIAIPAAIGNELAADAKLIVRQNLVLGAETVRLYKLFAAAGIPVLVLKGAALAQIAYGSLGVKHARDVDLLAPPDRAAAAMELLEHEGYALTSPAQRLGPAQRHALIQYGRESEFAHHGNGLLVELQWRIADNPLLLQGVDASSANQEVRLSDGAVIRTLKDADLFAALCVHGALHAWSRMKWLADVNAMIAASGGDVAQLYRHAHGIGAGLCAGQALLLCRELFALHLPPALEDEILSDNRIKKLVAIALAAMTAPQPTTDPERGVASMARLAYAHFLLGRGWRFFAAQCGLMSVGPTDVIRRPLPQSLHFLYPLLRVPLLLWRRGKLVMRRRP